MAGEIIVAVPVAHQDTYKIASKEADALIALHVSTLLYFAVASFYREFPDMTDREALDYLEGRMKTDDD